MTSLPLINEISWYRFMVSVNFYEYEYTHILQYRP